MLFTFILIFINLVGPSSSIAVINLTEDEGDRATFTCQADGEPLPTVSWYFNGVQLNESNTAKYDIVSSQFPNINIINTVLNILNVQSSDVGTYTCNTTNVISTDISSGVLTVNGKLLLHILIYGRLQKKTVYIFRTGPNGPDRRYKIQTGLDQT